MAGEHDWRQDGPYHWRCDRCGQREQQREKAKDCAPSPDHGYTEITPGTVPSVQVLMVPAPSPDPAALWALVRRWREEASAKPRPDRAYHHGERNKARRCADELAALLPPEGP